MDGYDAALQQKQYDLVLWHNLSHSLFLSMSRARACKHRFLNGSRKMWTQTYLVVCILKYEQPTTFRVHVRNLGMKFALIITLYLFFSHTFFSQKCNKATHLTAPTTKIKSNGCLSVPQLKWAISHNFSNFDIQSQVYLPFLLEQRFICFDCFRDCDNFRIAFFFCWNCSRCWLFSFDSWNVNIYSRYLHDLPAPLRMKKKLILHHKFSRSKSEGLVGVVQVKNSFSL